MVERHAACAEAVVQAVEHRKKYRGEVQSSLRPDRFIDLRAFPSSEGADSLRVEVRRALFRIVQETFPNVHRHACASRVAVDLRSTPGEVILCVADDGHGMQAKPAASKAGKPNPQRGHSGHAHPPAPVQRHPPDPDRRHRDLVRARVPCTSENLAGATAAQVRSNGVQATFPQFLDFLRATSGFHPSAPAGPSGV